MGKGGRVFLIPYSLLLLIAHYSLLKQGGEKMASIAERVKDLVVEQLGVNPEQVTSEASFVDDLGADSLDTVELVMAFEEEFDMEIPDEEAEEIVTVGKAIEYIEEHT